jgi:hypothetical protein
MASHLEPSTQNLGIVICFLLVAYIFYFLGSNQSHPTYSAETEPANKVSAEPSPEYLQGFKDGRKAFLELGRADLRRDIKQEDRKLEQELKKKMAEVDKQENIRQKWFEERKLAMKGWREEELDSIWRGKQARERGIAGWLRFGGRRKVRKEAEKTGEGKEEKKVEEKKVEEKKVEEKWIDEKRGWID